MTWFVFGGIGTVGLRGRRLRIAPYARQPLHDALSLDDGILEEDLFDDRNRKASY